MVQNLAWKLSWKRRIYIGMLMSGLYAVWSDPIESRLILQEDSGISGEMLLCSHAVEIGWGMCKMEGVSFAKRIDSSFI